MKKFKISELRRLLLLSHDILNKDEMKEFSIYNSPQELTKITTCLQNQKLIDENFNTVVIVNGEFQLSPFVNEVLFFALSDIKIDAVDWEGEDVEPIIFEHGSIGMIYSSDFLSKLKFVGNLRMIIWLRI